MHFKPRVFPQNIIQSDFLKKKIKHFKNFLKSKMKFHIGNTNKIEKFNKENKKEYYKRKIEHNFSLSIIFQRIVNKYLKFFEH